jgi:acyl-coenzyme A thioesterase PaaI-like protein
MNHRLFKFLLNAYPPYWGTGISIKRISPDFGRMTVRMKMRWYNRNYMGTHFGGSLYAMVDPFYMLMLIQILGEKYVVWDKSALIDFVKPGKGTVTAEFHVERALIDTIKARTAEGEKYLPELTLEIKDRSGEIVARVVKTLYVRRKTTPEKRSGS